MFQVNDHVVYGNYGICVVKAIGSLEMDSVVKDRLYYTLEPLYSEKNTIYTPVDKEEFHAMCDNGTGGMETDRWDTGTGDDTGCR